MALYYDLPVFRDVYKLILMLFDYTKDFPRDYKYTLGQDRKRGGIVLVTAGTGVPDQLQSPAEFRWRFRVRQLRVLFREQQQQRVEPELRQWQPEKQQTFHGQRGRL